MIDQPTQRETTVRLAGGGTGIGVAQLRVTLTLPGGESESADLAVRTLSDIAGAWVGALRLHDPRFGIDWTAWAGPSVGR